MKTKRLYEFGPYRLDPQEAVLLRDGKPVYLKPKVLETLIVMVENRGRILDKETLMHRLWQDTFVEEANLTVNISQLRKALGQSDEGDQFIETVPRRGYRFVAEVREVWTEEAALVVKEYTSSRITIEEKETDDAEKPNPVTRSSAQTVDVQAAHYATEQSLPSGAVAQDITTRLSRLNKVASSKKTLAAIAVTLIATIAATTILLLGRNRTPRFQKIEINAIPNTGYSSRIAISPDGKLLARVAHEGGKSSLLLRQLATSKDVELIAPGEESYGQLMFSRDGNHIYYLVSMNRNDPTNALYVMPAFGGRSKRLIENISAFTLSPDNKQIAFFRNTVAESSLVIAVAEGNEEKTLATRAKPDFFFHPAWSPDGEIIACTVVGYEGNKRRTSLVEIRVVDGTQRPITSEQWGQPYGLEWIADGSGLMLNAIGNEPPATLWFVSYPDGQVRTIAKDANNYLGFSLSADSEILVCQRNQSRSDLWLVSLGDANQAKQITTGTSNYIDPSLTPDGRIVSVSRATGNLEVWIMDADGANRKQLTVNDRPNCFPAISPDGRYIVFTSNLQIWRMDIDGNNLKQLTNGGDDRNPQVSSDGKWVVYDSLSSTIKKVPIDGGESIPMTTKESFHPTISPDGKYIAYFQRDNDKTPWSLVIMPFDGGQPARPISLAKTVTPVAGLCWLPDSGSIAYVELRNGASNIWTLPLYGGSPKQLTDFESDQIDSFDISRDGKQIVCSRRASYSDLVLMKNEN